MSGLLYRASIWEMTASSVGWYPFVGGHDNSRAVELQRFMQLRVEAFHDGDQLL
jgi:hypothetical protein